MPLIKVSLIEEVFSNEEKQQIISKITDAMVSIKGERLRPITWVVVEEMKGGDWGIGGKGLHAKDVHALLNAAKSD